MFIVIEKRIGDLTSNLGWDCISFARVFRKVWHHPSLPALLLLSDLTFRNFSSLQTKDHYFFLNIKLLDMFWTKFVWYLISFFLMFVFTQSLCYRQGEFSFSLIGFLYKAKNTLLFTHAFHKSIIVNWNTNSLVLVLNSGLLVYFLWWWLLHYMDLLFLGFFFCLYLILRWLFQFRFDLIYIYIYIYI